MLLSTDFKILLAKSTADSCRFPELIKMAISSALLKEDFPLSSNFSRGLSSSFQFLIEKGFSEYFFIALVKI